MTRGAVHDPMEHERFIRERVGLRLRSRAKRVTGATDDEMREHLMEMVRKHGRRVLTPVESRLLERLR